MQRIRYPGGSKDTLHPDIRPPAGGGGLLHGADQAAREAGSETTPGLAPVNFSPPVTSSTPNAPLSLARVARTWWPLAASWLLMGVEFPLLTAVVERMEDPDVNLAAYGSVVFPLALIVEAPIIMLLAAATALVRDRASYARLHHFMMVAGAALTAIHVGVAFTPLFDVVCLDLLGVPEELLEPARGAMRIMTPWTWAIAYRRMQQGLLIRAGHSRIVGIGTLVRLGSNVLAMTLVAKLTDLPGSAVGACGIATGVTLEALFAGVLVRPCVRELQPLDVSIEPLTWSRLGRFYTPLAMTPLMTLILPLVGSAAMARMTDSFLSLAAWPAVHGLVFLFRGIGMAYNEVVVALFDEPGSVPVLRRFSLLVAMGATAVLGLLVATPFADLWFEDLMNLSPELAHMTRIGVALSLLMPAYQVLQSWFQGVLVASGKTRAVPEAVAAYAVVVASLFGIGVAYTDMPGLYFAVLTFTCGGLTQTTWLWWRSRATLNLHTKAQGTARA
jgi:hypothetical protein